MYLRPAPSDHDGCFGTAHHFSMWLITQLPAFFVCGDRAAACNCSNDVPDAVDSVSHMCTAITALIGTTQDWRQPSSVTSVPDLIRFLLISLIGCHLLAAVRSKFLHFSDKANHLVNI
jgi:hypothetical protein